MTHVKVPKNEAYMMINKTHVKLDFDCLMAYQSL